MGYIAYQLTLVGTTPRNLSDAFPADGRAIGSKYDVPLRLVTFQALKANTTDVFIGSDNLITSTVHGFRVDSTDASPPIVLGSYDTGGSKFSDFWAAGASGGEVLLISGVTF